jgi:hypothetical protein
MNPIPNTADELLLKKFLGVPDAFPGSLYTSEAAGNARPLVFSSQILGQTIPSSADQLGITTSSTPSQYIYGQLDSTGGVYSYKNITTQLTSTTVQTTSQILIGTIWSSSSYPHIQKVKCTLSAVNPGVSYRFSDPASSITNYLSQAIPFNFDLAGGTYKYNIVYSNTNNTITQSYYVDTDAGYLYFPNQGDLFSTVLDNNNPILPIITFYRYNGSSAGNVVINTNSNLPISLSGSSQASPIILNLPSTLSGAYNCSPITGSAVYLDFSGGISNSSYIFYIPNCSSPGQIIFTSFSVLSNFSANIATPYVISPSSSSANATCNVIMVVTVYNNMYHVALSSYNTPDITPLTTAEIRSLSPSQLNSLTQFQVANLTSTQIISLSSTQINSLTTTTTRLFTTAQTALFNR